MGQRTQPRGAPGSADPLGSQEGPEGSGLFATFYVIGTEPRADVEERIGKTKRLLKRFDGFGANARASSWMEGFHEGREYAKKPPIVITTKKVPGKKKTA